MEGQQYPYVVQFECIIILSLNWRSSNKEKLVKRFTENLETCIFYIVHHP